MNQVLPKFPTQQFGLSTSSTKFFSGHFRAFDLTSPRTNPSQAGRPRSLPLNGGVFLAKILLFAKVPSMVFGLAYSSRALTAFDDEALLELADCAAAKNEQLGLTGYLYFRNKLFIQYLEGEQKAVENLMAKIKTDPRHEVTSIVPLPSCPERIFPHWYMRFLGSDLPKTQTPTLEDELSFILETTAKDNYSTDEVAEAILHVTRRIASLDW